MNEFIEKLIGRLEEKVVNRTFDESIKTKNLAYKEAIEIVNQLAEEYKNGWIEKLLEAKRNCGEDSDCSQCPFGQIEDRCILAELQVDADLKRNNGWIPCSERLPEDFMSFEYLTIRKGHTLATITYYCVANKKWYLSRNSTREIKVVAWQPLPAPYQPKGE